MERGRSLPATAVLGLLPAVLGGLGGCGLIRTTTELPGRMASAALKPGVPVPDPSLVQSRFMRFADFSANEINRATREFAELSGTPEGHIQALTWRIDYTNGLWRLAAAERPYAALFDGIVLITFGRIVHEEHCLSHWGEAARPMLDSMVRLEEGIWALAGEWLSEAHLAEVRRIVATWLAGDPASRIVDVAKLPGFGELVTGGDHGSSSLVGDLTNLMRVDPLAGLEPAVREVEQSRQLAERVFYYGQRMPELLSARVELMALRLSQSPEAIGSLASVERVSRAAESLAATAEALPADIAAEREAALEQISSELTAQRAGLVHDLETARAPLSELLGSVRGTAEASGAMADSLNEALRTLDAFVGRFDEPDVAPAGAVESAAAAEVPGDEPAGRPFDITEYGAAAERIGIAARELGETIATLDRSLPQVQRLLEEAAARGDRSIDHAFVRALQLLVAALVGSALTILVVRRLRPS